MNNKADSKLKTEKVYIAILVQSLEQKNMVLDALVMQTKLQEDILKKDSFDEALFSDTITEKKKLIDKLEQMDEGFEQVYNKASQELKDNAGYYATQIEQMKMLISQVTQKSASIEAIEHRNKERLDIVLLNERKRIREYTVNSKTAANYYKNMSKLTGSETFFMDKKS